MTVTVENKSRKEVFVYDGQAGKDMPRFDFTRELPAIVQPTPHYVALTALVLLPARPANPPLPAMGIVGALEIMGRNVTQWMPANLTRCHPDKFGDAFFVERRLNGFNPGKLKRVQKQKWQYAVRYDCTRYEKDPASILPDVIEARFGLHGKELRVHSIQFSLKGETSTHVPGDADWEWSKQLFRSAEFVFHETQSHLARTHMNMDQYAMAFYRNIINNPIWQLLEPHFEGLLNIDKVGSALILGDTGFLPQTSVLTSKSVDEVVKEEVTILSYHWKPSTQALPDKIHNNYFDQASLTMWRVLEDYVGDFFDQHKQGIQDYWSEIEGMSKDLVEHSILKPKLGTLAVANMNDLKQLCVYVIYHCSFFHSWVNYKQYEDGGDVSYASIGLWDKNDPAYNPMSVAQKQATQAILMWTLSNVRYNPIMEVGPVELKNLLWKQREKIEPGIPLETLMMSIHI
jgi:linolenate 9R-lipoxygenase